MERRRSERRTVEIPAVLNVLTEIIADQGQGPEYRVIVEEISGHGARIRVPAPIKVNALIKLVVDDDMFLGEVSHCRQDGDVWVAGIHLDCALTSLSSVRSLMRALMPAADLRRNDAADACHHADRQKQGERDQQQPSQPLSPAAPK